MIIQLKVKTLDSRLYDFELDDEVKFLENSRIKKIYRHFTIPKFADYDSPIQGFDCGKN